MPCTATWLSLAQTCPLRVASGCADLTWGGSAGCTDMQEHSQSMGPQVTLASLKTDSGKLRHSL